MAERDQNNRHTTPYPVSYTHLCNAIGAHHDETEMTSLLAPIVQVCDCLLYTSEWCPIKTPINLRVPGIWRICATVVGNQLFIPYIPPVLFHRDSSGTEVVPIPVHGHCNPNEYKPHDRHPTESEDVYKRQPPNSPANAGRIRNRRANRSPQPTSIQEVHTIDS